MKYNVGDVVVIRNDLNIYDMYDHNGEKEVLDLADDMLEHLGKQATIIGLREGNYKFYLLDVDDGYRNWSDGMFEEKDMSIINGK